VGPHVGERGCVTRPCTGRAIALVVIYRAARRKVVGVQQREREWICGKLLLAQGAEDGARDAARATPPPPAAAAPRARARPRALLARRRPSVDHTIAAHSF
jgi:hypothetical protein